MLVKLMKSNKNHDFVEILRKTLKKSSRNHSFLYLKSWWRAALNTLAGRVFEVPLYYTMKSINKWYSHFRVTRPLQIRRLKSIVTTTSKTSKTKMKTTSRRNPQPPFQRRQLRLIGLLTTRQFVLQFQRRQFGRQSWMNWPSNDRRPPNKSWNRIELHKMICQQMNRRRPECQSLKRRFATVLKSKLQAR